MNTGSLTREHKLFIAAGGSVLFVIAMFINWFGVGGEGGDAFDLLPSPWIFLIFGIVAALAFAAEALNFELPIPFNPVVLGTYLASVLAILSIAYLIEGGPMSDLSMDRKFGLFLAVIGSVAAVIAGAIAARDRG